MTDQPAWKLVANLGDQNPLEHGGLFVYRDETGVYCEKAVKLDPMLNGTFEVRRFCLEKCTYENGVLSDNPYHKDHPVWFGDRTPDKWNPEGELKKLADYTGQTEEGLIKAFCSDNPCDRAMAYESVGNYHGWENLDEYPVTLTYEEAKEKYGDLRGDRW